MTGADPLLAAIVDHTPGDPQEAADLDRLRSLAASGADPWDRSTPLHATGSAFVVDRAGGRVLLRWHERQGAWIQVGGHADPGETDPLAVALREGAEETGLGDLRPLHGRTGPVHVVVVPVPARGDEPDHEHADIRFVLTTDHPERVRPESETAELRWLGIDAAMALTTEANVRESLRRVAALVPIDGPDGVG